MAGQSQSGITPGERTQTALGTDAAPLASTADAPAPTHPAQIGTYRILDVLGRGGMGIVYRAEQASPRRDVALKVIGRGFVSERLLRRFELEAQTLGRLKHVGIAQIYEAGVNQTALGPQPFFAMELVEGESLDDYSSKQTLDTNAKLELLIRICDAVQYAHQQGVIHRDLKPGNILVTSDGQPKILDFGVARATDADVRTTTMQTDVGQLIGTLPYMSPEQASGEPDEIDTRSDVYALGVIAYELLSGRVPHDLQGIASLEAARRIREQEPSRLSSIDRTFRGDVETIVQTALEKDKSRRYQSANALADDVKRYLYYEPIAARPPSTWYNLKKFARRNKVVVSGVALLIIVLAAGAFTSTWFWIRATRQEREARTQAEIATAVSEFLTKRVLAGARPDRIPDKTVRDAIVRTMLDPAAASVAHDFKDKPLTEVAVRNSLALSYHAVGRTDLSVPHAQAAVALCRRVLGDDHPGTLTAMDCAGALLQAQGKLDQAEPLLRESLERSRRILGDDHPATLNSINNLGSLFQVQGKLDQAEPLLREVMERSRRVRGDDHPHTLTAVNNTGHLLHTQGKRDQAEPLYREALSRRRRVLGDDHPDTLSSIGNMGNLLLEQRKPDQAEPLLREALARRRRVLGDDHPDTLIALNSVAGLVQAQGQLDQAEPLRREALERSRRMPGEDHPLTLRLMNNLGNLLQAQRKFDQAEPLLRESLERSRRVLGDDHPDTLISLNNLGHLLSAQGKHAEAEEFYREAATRAMASASLGPGHPYTAGFGSNHIKCLNTLGRHNEAAAVRRKFGLADPPTRAATAPASQP